MWRISLRLSLFLFLASLAVSTSCEDKILWIYESELTELEETLNELKTTTGRLQKELIESMTLQERLEKELTTLSSIHEQSMNELTRLSTHWKEYERETNSLLARQERQIKVRNWLIMALSGVSFIAGLGGMFIW